MNCHPPAILAVIQRPGPTVVFELISLRQRPARVLRVIARHNSSVAVPKLDQPVRLHKAQYSAYGRWPSLLLVLLGVD